MGFLSGSVSLERYWITADPTGSLGEEHLSVLEKFKIGAFEKTALEEPNVGFVGGAHLLDTQFDLAKNVIVDAMHFGIRIDSDQVPSALRKAWLQQELLPLIVDNPSGKPTKAQREEAKEAVEARCQEEARNGKFRRLQQVPVLWDAQNEVLYLGGTSPKSNELCIDLMERAFGLELERITSGSLAKTYAGENDLMGQLYELCPASFVGEQEAAGQVTWWNGMAENFDYLGNEFLLWLWWYFENESDTVKLQDESRVTGMFARSLMLDCPRGESGKESFSAESPVALPEASLGARSGKLPRRAGLTLVREDQQLDLTLQAELFTLGSARMKPLGDAPADHTTEDRINSVRLLGDTVDFLFEAFCERRLGAAWKSDLKAMRAWLQDESPLGIRKSAA